MKLINNLSEQLLISLMPLNDSVNFLLILWFLFDLLAMVLLVVDKFMIDFPPDSSSSPPDQILPEIIATIIVLFPTFSHASG